MEREHLSRVSTEDGDRLIIDQVTDERDLLDAIELVLNCTFSEKALKQALYLLQRGTTQFGNFNPENFGEVDRALNDRQQIANLEKAVAKLEQLVTMWKLAYLSQVRYPEEEEINVWDLPGNWTLDKQFYPCYTVYVARKSLRWPSGILSFLPKSFSSPTGGVKNHGR